MVQRFERPASVAEAARLRFESGGSFLAGGTQLNIGGAPEVEALIALDGLALDFVREDAGSFRIGPTLTLQALADHRALVEAGLGVLCEAARDVGNRAVRNQATLGGNLASRLSYSDMAPPLVALDAVLELRTADGEREMSVEEYERLPDAGALITCVRVPRPDVTTRVARRRFARTSADLPLVNVALVLAVTDAGIARARLAIGGLTAAAARVPAAERALVGGEVSADAVRDRFAAAVREGVHAVADLRGGVEFKTHLAVELACQALADCLRKERA